MCKTLINFLACVSLILVLPPALAVSPGTIQQGRTLFEQTWSPRNPSISPDGLGPLFNAVSCVACHNQSGTGGGGAAEFNALTIGIERLKITGGPVDNSVLRQMVSSFHPGFILPDKTLINTFTVSHHGGSPLMANSRSSMRQAIPIAFSNSGGPQDATEMRVGTGHQVVFKNKIGKYEMELHARLYGRNTTALYGAGLLDQVSDKEILQLAKLQKKHPEISGRPSTLNNGTIGKFGWRANLASLAEFTDQASANELGLETKRRPQGTDPATPHYRNPGIDISDDQVLAMRDFVASLPAPIRSISSDSKTRLMVQRGQQIFGSVGCAVCHVPTVGPAQGIYSDVLLHDMGAKSIDLNHAEPYIKRITPYERVELVSEIERVQGNGSGMVGGYYGPATAILIDFDEYRVKRSNSGRSSRRASPIRNALNFEFVAPEYPKQKMQLVDLRSDDSLSTSRTELSDEEFKAKVGLLGAVEGKFSSTETSRTRKTQYVRVHYEATNFNQEWRTPPLWGVADSAPYMHEGRGETLLETITMHGGESAGTRDRFLNLPLVDRRALIAFLETMKAPPVPGPAK